MSAENSKEFQEKLKNVLLFMFNINYDDFDALLKNMLEDQNLVDSYIEEHWTEMRSNPARWFLNLGSDEQAVLIEAAFKKYSK